MNECAICGHAASDVSMGLIWWRETGYQAVDAMPRCRDLEACKARIAAKDEPWPVMDPPKVKAAW